MFTRHLVPILLFSAAMAGDSLGQSEVAAKPIVGLRDNRPSGYALLHADVVVQPGEVIADATVLVAGTSITAVGRDLKAPAGYQSIDCSGKKIYAGLIDAWGEIDVPKPTSETGYWNSNVVPHRAAATEAAKDLDQASKYRGAGFTARVIAPRGGIVKGSSCVVLLSDGDAGRALLMETAWHHLQLTVPRSGSRPRYPNSPMGATALLRQSLYDASWYREAWDAYRANGDVSQPETNLALASLSRAIVDGTFVIDTRNERMAVRAGKIADEFNLKTIIRGSGREYRALDEIAAMNRPVLVPVDFPAAPNVKTTEASRNASLQELMHWDLAPGNPARLADKGVEICLTTDGLSNVSDFLKQVRKAVDRGLDADTALAAMTTIPARLLEIDDRIGRVRPGMLANLVIVDGDLLAEGTKVIECWVAGERHEIDTPDLRAAPTLAGLWQLSVSGDGAPRSFHLELKQDGSKVSGELRDAQPTKEDSDEDDDDESKPKSAKLKDVAQQRDRLTATVDLSKIDPSLPSGITRLTIVTVAAGEAKPVVFASIALPGVATKRANIRPLSKPQPSDTAGEEDDEEDNEEESDGSDEADDGDTSESEAIAATPILYPLGAYGLDQPISEQPTVLFRGATVWTCDDAGVLESADVLIRDGTVVAIGSQLTPPDGCQIVDARGKHITPGLIDCHSHMGTDGGVNESGQAVTAEVRIGDFIDNSDIQIYRQLAGGLTTSNILHGSANPIGGQNQVIKLRWGETMDGLRMTEAPAGIKFALGENVKRTQTRYPNTRMGVEQIIRDQLLAAREYDARWRRWNSGDRSSLPPRTDLQLQALAEVQRGERWIHCHSYRQDEIVATLDVLEEFGIQIGTLQHILEGYKVADRMARHGAMASAFSDWWAYKFEVYDGIPFNGALMHEQGVVVSFNSDDREIARHLNAEAAKATKYGAVSEIEALKFVTLNPAKQLRIEQHVGSLTVGKHADLVVWSGRPLSTTSRCEQTWIDGRLYFNLELDRQRRERDLALRQQLIRKALDGDPKPKGGKQDKEVAEEDRWVRYDVFCVASGDASQKAGQSGRGGERE